MLSKKDGFEDSDNDLPKDKKLQRKDSLIDKIHAEAN